MKSKRFHNDISYLEKVGEVAPFYTLILTLWLWVLFKVALSTIL